MELFKNQFDQPKTHHSFLDAIVKSLIIFIKMKIFNWKKWRYFIKKSFKALSSEVVSGYIRII